MKKLMLAIAITLTPFLLVNSASAEEAAAPKAKKSAEAQKPSLTFYYFDG